MPNILAIDTSTDSCSAALYFEEMIFLRFEIAPRRHAELILLMIDDLLQKAKCKLQDLDAVAFGCGPGSFIGVRLATSVAQGLGFSAALPLIPISSLQTLAQCGGEELACKFVLAGWDARMGEIYWGAYEKNAHGIMLPLGQEQLSSPAAIRAAPDKSWTLVGNAWSIYQAELLPQLRGESHLLYPRAESMLTLAQYYLKQGKTVTPLQAEPNYLRQQVAKKEG